MDKMQTTILIQFPIAVVIVTIPTLAVPTIETSYGGECNMACLVSMTCRPKYTGCPVNVCLCDKGFTREDNRCVKEKRLRRVHYRCNSDTDRCEGVTECIDGVCQCQFELLYNSLLNTCVKAKKSVINECCDYTAQCEDVLQNNGTICLNGTCACASGYVQDGFLCRKPLYGELCEEEVGCGAPPKGLNALQCRRNMCRCPVLSSEIVKVDRVHQGCKRATGLRRVGQSCMYHADCFGTNTICAACSPDSKACVIVQETASAATCPTVLLVNLCMVFAAVTRL